jgi:hypothetical protein
VSPTVPLDGRVCQRTEIDHVGVIESEAIELGCCLLESVIQLSGGWGFRTGHWSAVNTGLTNAWVGALVINPSTPDILYAGTDGGAV